MILYNIRQRKLEYEVLVSITTLDNTLMNPSFSIDSTDALTTPDRQVFVERLSRILNSDVPIVLSLKDFKRVCGDLWKCEYS